VARIEGRGKNGIEMKNGLLTRRAVFWAGGGLLVNAALSRHSSAADMIEIHMRSDPSGGVVGFDPVGLFIQPGQTVRWVCDDNVHTATAYSPENENHSLRIPKEAQSWASEFLLPGQQFELRLAVEGVYDYFCAPHEVAGMVGRLVVGRPIGPGTLPFDYFKVRGETWDSVPPAAQQAFPTVSDIMENKVVRSRLNFAN
jgi:plastocyanin